MYEPFSSLTDIFNIPSQFRMTI